MKTFCVIQCGVAHELIVADEWPFHPGLPYVEVDPAKPVELGDRFDEGKGTFTKPPARGGQPQVTRLNAISLYKLTPTNPLAPHSHPRAHLLVVASGRVRVTEADVQWEMDAPSICTLAAKMTHGVEAITPTATILSIFAEDL